MDDCIDRLGNAIRTVREEQGLTQQAAAERIGITTKTLQNIENNKSDPKLSTLDALFCMLKIDPAYIFDHDSSQSIYMTRLLGLLSSCSEVELRTVYGISEAFLCSTRDANGESSIRKSETSR